MARHTRNRTRWFELLASEQETETPDTPEGHPES
jgi:hypothetical protein